MAEVHLKNITKIFDRFTVALDDFDLQVKDREFVSILGPSGSGKSTILRIIAGLEHQDKGEVFINGGNVNKLAPQERDVAFVFQNYALFPHMDVEENIAVGLRLKGYSRSEIQKRIKEVSDLLEITALLKRKPRALSGGQRQRVALARAIAKRPKVFLLDEPLSNLDAILREKMRTELKILFKKIKGTVIYVTHDQTEAMCLSDRIALIDKGKLNQVGSADALYYQPAGLFVASFLGTPRINVFEVAIEERSFVWKDLQWDVPQTYWPVVKDRDRLILGIRPEDLKVYLESKPQAAASQLIMVEKIGKYTILNLRIQNHTLKAMVEKDFSDRLHSDNLWIEFDMRKIYLFDIGTQESLK